jgi:hypothetical protein
MGPHVTEGRLTALHYRNLLEDELPLHLDNVPLATQRPMWLHDGAPRHFGGAVMECLWKDYKRRWIGEVDRWLGPLGLLT